MNADEHRARARLACIADASRFQIALLLRERDWYVSELAVAVGKSQSCTTRHLQAMAREGLVHRRRAGRRVMFGLDGALDWLDHLTAGEAPTPPAGAGRRVRRDGSAPADRRGVRADRPHRPEPIPAPPPAPDPPDSEAPGTPTRRQDLEDFLL